MHNGYFHRVTAQSPTRFWINNPTWSEARLAIDAGAINCTTNPAYLSKMLLSEEVGPDIIAMIDETIKSGEIDRAAIPETIQRRVVARLCAEFKPVYDRNPGYQGFVSLQLDPNKENDPDNFIKEALEGRKLMPNVLPKIPVTASGLKAIEELVRRDIPIIATEIMSISQMISACEAYQRVSNETGNTPAFFVTHITGIFDDYMKKTVAQNNISISKDVLFQAGLAVARKQYRLMKERSYPGIILGGGARGLHHFTEFVGGDFHITINWKGTAQNLIEQDPPVIYRIDTQTPEYVLDNLISAIPDFRKAYYPDALPVEEYANFGPVELFRSQFLEGWKALVNAVNSRM